MIQDELCTMISTQELTEATLHIWLTQNANQYKLKYLLAHADDGVIWGHFKANQLITADYVFEQLPQLRLQTLQQCRLFSPQGELLLWRDNLDWKARLIQDTQGCCYLKPDEKQILWGDRRGKDDEREGFTLLTEGQQRFRHAVPKIGLKFDKKDHPVRLQVRHYVDYDEDGAARIVLSRLVDLLPN